jgi:uncharacterized protein YgiM (DUF1202 family)
METLKPRARIRLEYRIQYQNPIRVTAGESVEVNRPDEDDPAWVWCRAADGREGWIPLELLAQEEGEQAIVLEDYSAEELAVQPGEEVEIEEVRHGWTLVRNAQGELGWIPESHLQI